MKQNCTKIVRPDAVRILKNLRKEALLLIKQWNRPENLFVLNGSKAAFVIIDMQNFSCVPTNGRALPRINQIVRQINRLVDFCRTIGVPVIWVRQNITMDQTCTDAGLYPIFHDMNHLKSMCNLSIGTEIFPEMHFDPSRDHVVFKNRYSAFLSKPPELREKLDSLMRTQLIFAGIAANICVESTIRDAMQLDYEAVLVSDGITSFDEIILESTIINTKLFFGDVRTTKEIIEELMESGN